MKRFGPLVLVTALIVCACATPPRTPKDCRGRAEAQYQLCLRPYRPADQPLEPTRSDEAQACQRSYQQALAACGGGEPRAPVPRIGTSTVSAD